MSGHLLKRSCSLVWWSLIYSVPAENKVSKLDLPVGFIAGKEECYIFEAMLFGL